MAKNPHEIEIKQSPVKLGELQEVSEDPDKVSAPPYVTKLLDAAKPHGPFSDVVKAIRASRPDPNAFSLVDGEDDSPKGSQRTR